MTTSAVTVYLNLAFLNANDFRTDTRRESHANDLNVNDFQGQRVDAGS